MTIEARPYTPAMRTAWNALNARARNGHFMFDRGFMEYHGDRFQDASMAVFEGDQIVGLLPANRAGEAIHSHQGLTFGGLIIDTLRTTEVMASLDACAAYWRGEGATRLIYKPAPWIYHRRPAQEDLYWLFRRNATLTIRQASASVLFDAPGALSRRRRRGATKAAAAGLAFGRSTRIEDFWLVLEAALAERHGARPVHSAAEARRLADGFPEAIQLHTAESGGEILAGALLFVAGPVVHAQYIATTPDGRRTGALDGLFARLLDAPWPHARVFDFGTSNEDQGRRLNEGLIGQKEEFGAGVVAYDIYEVALGDG